MEILCALIICMAVVLQGGFYVNTAVILSAAVFVIFTIKGTVSFKELAIAALVYAAMMFACAFGGFSVFSIERSVPPVCCFMFYLAVRKQKNKYNILKYVLFFAAGLSGICILSYCGLFFELPGNTAAGRMNMTFQYANAAGIFNAVMAMLVMTEFKRYERRLLPLFLTVLLLTRSTGAAAVCFIGLCILWRKHCITVKKAEFGAVSVVISAVLIASVRFSCIPAAIVGCAVLAAYCIFSKENERISAKIYIIILVLAAFVAVMAMPKAVSSSQTFLERLIQIKDGIRCCAENRFVGIGNGNWKYIKEYFQSAQYSAAVIHSTPVQFMVEYGILPAAAVFALTAVGIYRADKFSVKVIMAMFLMHSVLDMTGSFLSLGLLFALLFAYSYDSVPDTGKSAKAVFVPTAAVIIGISVFALSLSQMAGAYIGGSDYRKMCDMYLKYEKILKNDKEMIQNYYITRKFMGKEKDVLEYEHRRIWKDMIIMKSEAYTAAQTDERLELLLKAAEEQPYCVEYYREVYKLLPYVDDKYASRYNALAERVNSENSLLKNQTKINYYKEN